MKKNKKFRKIIRIIKKTKIWWAAICAILASCGTTKVAVSRAEAGTYTTITVTTNNPITTNVEPKTDVKL